MILPIIIIIINNVKARDPVGSQKNYILKTYSTSTSAYFDNIMEMEI